MSPAHTIEVNQACDALERVDRETIEAITLWLADCEDCDTCPRPCAPEPLEHVREAHQQPRCVPQASPLPDAGRVLIVLPTLPLCRD